MSSEELLRGFALKVGDRWALTGSMKLTADQLFSSKSDHLFLILSCLDAMPSARSLALQVLLSWHRTGTYPDQLLRDLLEKNPRIKPVDRALIYQLVYGVLRWQGKLDWVIKQFSQRPLEKLSLKTLFILRLGVFQILFLSRIPVSAAVNESVKLAKSGRSTVDRQFCQCRIAVPGSGKRKSLLPFQGRPGFLSGGQFLPPGLAGGTLA